MHLARIHFTPNPANRKIQPARLKNCTARSCFSAAWRVLNVPRLRRLPVFGSSLREYKRYWPELSLRTIGTSPDEYAPQHPNALTRGPFHPEFDLRASRPPSDQQVPAIP